MKAKTIILKYVNDDGDGWEKSCLEEVEELCKRYDMYADNKSYVQRVKTLTVTLRKIPDKEIVIK